MCVCWQLYRKVADMCFWYHIKQWTEKSTLSKSPLMKMKTQSLHSSFTVNPVMYCYRSRRASACYRPWSASTALCILTHQVMPFPMLNRTDTVDMDWHDLSVTQIKTKVTQIKYNFFFLIRNGMEGSRAHPVYSRDCLKLIRDDM